MLLLLSLLSFLLLLMLLLSSLSSSWSLLLLLLLLLLWSNADAFFRSVDITDTTSVSISAPRILTDRCASDDDDS